jgi:deoxyribonuclease-4
MSAASTTTASASTTTASASAAAVATPFRVRQLLSSLNPVETATLKKLLPRGVAKAPEEPVGTRYPAALLSALPDGDEYSLLGFISEDLLRLDPHLITSAALAEVVTTRAPGTDVAKVLRSKTTDPYLQHLRQTCVKLRLAARGAIQGESEVGTGNPVVGHPDMRTEKQIFEIKMTGQLKKNWPAFLLQVFAYGALEPTVTDLYLVLPLQEIVHHFPLSAWTATNRAAFRATLFTAAANRRATEGEAAALIETHHIGLHVSKQRTLADTVRSLPYAATRPYQIFLSGPQSAHMVVKPDDVTAAAALVSSTGARVYIHSQYLINLATPPPADGTEEVLHTGLLIKNLQAGAAMGARGVVVHVGKHTTQDPDTALAHMRANVLHAMEFATEACPILLETPAGQGTEMLRTYEEFVGFVSAFDDPRLRICVDTCHVFVCGTDPLTYINRLTTEHPGLLALIHFNDSAAPCGSCADRHAYIGQGQIGMAGMTALAAAGTAVAAPMVIEY